MFATMPRRTTVHVFSVIPRLSQLVRDQLPDVDIVSVPLTGKTFIFVVIIHFIRMVILDLVYL